MALTDVTDKAVPNHADSDVMGNDNDSPSLSTHPHPLVYSFKPLTPMHGFRRLKDRITPTRTMRPPGPSQASHGIDSPFAEGGVAAVVDSTAEDVQATNTSGKKNYLGVLKAALRVLEKVSEDTGVPGLKGAIGGLVMMLDKVDVRHVTVCFCIRK